MHPPSSSRKVYPRYGESFAQSASQRLAQLQSNIQNLSHDLGNVSEDVEQIEYERQLLEIVRLRIEMRHGYIRVAGLSLFFVIYVIMIFLQQNIQTSFGIESRYLDPAMVIFPLLGFHFVFV